ncbi:MAG: nicotinate (nicotinamide) nucleotide adenylyltransferase [Planctomycetota bacterium]|nr:nicotinate (nicotinamide) nucleotide adenylyltransferase [Planctomycetota bacterium]
MARGIFGGSFDPIHVGHVALATGALRARGLERVSLIPAGRPPHKKTGCVASFADRLEMVRLAVEGCHGLDVLDLEGRRPGRSYSIDTVEALQAEHPGVEWELLVGADMLEDLPRWRRASELVVRVQVVAFGRPDADTERARAAFLAAFPGHEAAFLELPLVDASGTAIRRRLGEALPVEGLVSPKVQRYVRDKGLYGAGPKKG